MWTSHKSSSCDRMPKSTCPYFNYMQTNRVQLSNNKFMIDFESLKENDIFILEIISFTCILLNANLSGYTGTHQFPFVKRDLRRFCDNLPNRQKQIAAWIYNEYRWFPPTSRSWAFWSNHRQPDFLKPLPVWKITYWHFPFAFTKFILPKKKLHMQIIIAITRPINFDDWLTSSPI